MRLSSTAFPCCRAHDLFAPLEEYGESVKRAPGDDVYLFHWNSSFNGSATIRVSRLAGEVAVSRAYKPSTFGKVRRLQALISAADWLRLEDAIVAANFWMLDNNGGRHGLDGSMWHFAGRRRLDYHYISRWSPDGALWTLGRCFFDIAGLAETRVY